MKNFAIILRKDYLKSIKDAKNNFLNLKFEKFGSEIVISGSYGDLEIFNNSKDIFAYSNTHSEIISIPNIKVNKTSSYFFGNEIPDGKFVNPEFQKWINKVVRFDNQNRCHIYDSVLSHKVFQPCGNLGFSKYVPRQYHIIELAKLGDDLCKEFLDKNPMPKLLIDELPKVEYVTLYGLFTDGGNCYSALSNDSGKLDRSKNWYWSKSDDMTVGQFKASLRRMAENRAQENYRYYCKGSWDIHVYKDKEKFIKDANSVGINPRLD